jgi:RNA-splicing ligase RtcB
LEVNCAIFFLKKEIEMEEICLEYIGKYASCKVMIDEIEQEAVNQIYQFLNCPAFEGTTIRIMPDCHSGKGAVIGFTSTLSSKIIPNVVGVDIGCGVVGCCLGHIEYNNQLFEQLDSFIRKHIPSGFSVHDKFDSKIDTEEYQKVATETEQDDVNRVIRSLGTLGGGNHFIEVDKDQLGRLWVVIHSGARNFGLKICNYHQAKAVKTVGKGRGLEWLEGDYAAHYLDHLEIGQKYAHENRLLMVRKILHFFGLNIKELEIVESVHNYVDFEDGILRKGAISAQKGKRVIIPWNMRDGLVIGTGKGNEDWNYSAPHGAGRIMGRGQAKRTLDMEEYEETMQGIWTSCISKDTLDEAPMAYKDYMKIQSLIKDTVDVELILKPLYNFKAGKEQ